LIFLVVSVMSYVRVCLPLGSHSQVKKHDFSKRVFGEHKADEKRGTRSTKPGRRIDYLSARELAFHSRKLRQKIWEERALHWTMRARVDKLKMSTCGLHLSAEENLKAS
jgi:hypothetical protein